MVRKINVKENLMSIPMIPEFGVLHDEITFSTGYYPDNTYVKKQLRKNSSFTNFFEFLTACTEICNYEVPFSIEEFDTVKFERVPSRLTLGWTDDNNIYHCLYAILYVKPSPMTKADLDKFGIKLK